MDMDNKEVSEIMQLPDYTTVGPDSLASTIRELSQSHHGVSDSVYLLFENGQQKSLLEIAPEQTGVSIRHFDLMGRPANKAIKSTIDSLTQDDELLINFHDDSLLHLLKATDNGSKFGIEQLTEIPLDFKEALQYAHNMMLKTKAEENALKQAAEAKLAQQLAAPEAKGAGIFGLFNKPANKEKPAAKDQATHEPPKTGPTG